MDKQVVKHVNDLKMMHEMYVKSGRVDENIAKEQKRLIDECRQTDRGFIFLEPSEFTLFMDRYTSEENQKAVVVIEGGMIQSIYSNSPMEVVVIDTDTEGADQEDLVFDHEGEFFASYWESDVRPAMTAELYDVAIANPVRFVPYDNLEEFTEQTGIQFEPSAGIQQSDDIFAAEDSPEEIAALVENRAGRGEGLAFANVDDEHYIAYLRPLEQ